MLEAMREIEREYRALSGLQSRREYKIFYSRIHPFPLLVLGYNPGGDPANDNLSASDSYFENWEHDFPRFWSDPSYSLAKPICETLCAVLGTDSIDVLRQIPATNVIFRRSQDSHRLKMPARAAREAEPFLARVLEIVQPRAILIISKQACDFFARFHCSAPPLVEQPPGEAEKGLIAPNGSQPVVLYEKARARVRTLDREVSLHIIGHPSKFATRPQWKRVVAALQAGFVADGLNPIGGAIPRRSLPPLAGYGPPSPKNSLRSRKQRSK